MNPDPPIDPRSAAESNLTALLLGELPHQEAAALHQKLALDPELAARYERLKHTINLVRETVSSPAHETADQPAPLKLSEGRRQKLLQHFKTVSPKEFARPRQYRIHTLVQVGAAAAFVLLVAALLLPALSKSKSKGSRSLGMMSSLSQRTEDSLAQFGLSRRYDRSGREHPASDSAAGSTVLPAPTAAPASAPASAGAPAIILPHGGEVAEQASASGSRYVLHSAQVNKDRGLFDKAPQPSGSVDISFSGDAKPARASAASDFFSTTESAGTTELRRQLANQSQNAAFGESTLSMNAGSGASTSGNTGRASGGGTFPAAPPASPGDTTVAFALEKRVAQNAFPAPASPPGLTAPSSRLPAATSTPAQEQEKLGIAKIALPAVTPGPEPAAVTPQGAERSLERGATVAGLPPAFQAHLPSGPSDVNRNGVELLQERLAPAESPAKPASQSATPNTSSPTHSYYGGGAYGGYSTITPIPADAVVIGTVHIDGVGDVPITSEQPTQAGGKGISFETWVRRQAEQLPSKADQSPPAIAGDVLSSQTPEVNGKAKLAEAAQEQGKTPGFAWSAGDVAANGELKAQGGTGPSNAGQLLAESKSSAKPVTDLELAWSDNSQYQKQGNIRADADQVPALGDMPAAGRRFYRAKQEDLAGGIKIQPEDRVKSQELADNNAAQVDTTPGAAAAKSPKVLRIENADAGEVTNLLQDGLRDHKALPEQMLALQDKKGTTTTQRQRADTQAKESAQANEPDVSSAKSAAPPPIPQPEVQTTENAFSTFSLNVSDVSFKLAAASLEKGLMPEPGTVRSEEFINAFDYRDPEPPPGVPVAFAWERAQYPFAQNRDLLRFSIKTAAQGRQPGRPMNIVLLLDTSGSMERADRVQIIREALRVLAGQLQPQDKFSVVTFARTARLWVDGVAGNQAAQVVGEVSGIIPQGGTNLEDAMNLAYQTAQRHYLANGINRVVLLTDGAANLGDVEPETLKQKVESNRKQGIALDCFGIGWEGYNDDLLEVLSRNGDGRYGFINTPEEAATGFAAQLAGALQVAASDVKVQVDFNPARVTAYRQIGYAKHQLTKEQFRDNTVVAAQIGAAESGNALYVVEVNPAGQGPIATVRVRYRVPGTSNVHEHEWPVPYTGNAVPLDQSTSAMRLAATASAFSEWLVSSPYATEVTPDRLLGYLNGVPDIYGADARPKKLEWMLRQAKSISGK